MANFLSALPHTYYEENNLHGLLLAQIKEFATCLQATEQFLPYIDNWATCDLLSPPVFQSHTEQLLPAIQLWLQSPHCYTVRFSIGMLLRHYLDDHFQSVYSTMGSCGTLQRILCQYDDCLVFCNGTCQTADSNTAFSRKQTVGSLDSQKDNTKSLRKPSHSSRSKSLSENYFIEVNIHKETAWDTTLCHSAVFSCSSIQKQDLARSRK